VRDLDLPEGGVDDGAGALDFEGGGVQEFFRSVVEIGDEAIK
jgi:hypothetical protein